MAIQFEEMPNSRSIGGSPPTETRRYYCHGTSDQAEAYALAMLYTPPAIANPLGTLYRQDIQMDAQASNYYTFSIPYGPRQTFEAGSYSLSFDTTGGTVHITNSKETRDSYGAGGNPFVPDYKGAIGVDGDNVNGTEIVIPALKITVNFRHPAAVITLAKMKQLATITGTVNSGPFLTFAAGEVLFLGAQGEEGTETETSVSYQFACSQNATGLTFGDVASVAKRGWDALWIKYKDDVDTGYSVKRPEFVYVERVYEEINLAAALGFG